MKEEMINIVDDNNQVIDTVPRSIMRKGNLLHQVVHILVFNSQNELFVHQRTFEKDLNPGYYDVVVAGTVNTESYDKTAKRELLEEVGIRNVEIPHLFKIKYEDNTNRAFIQVYRCITDQTLTLQKEEIIHGKFMKIEDIEELMKKEKFTPEGLTTFQKYLEEFHETTQII